MMSEQPTENVVDADEPTAEENGETTQTSADGANHSHEVLTRNAEAALSRARNVYVFAVLLFVAFWFMSGRAGYEFDQMIPHPRCTQIRILSLVTLIGGMVLTGVRVRRCMVRRAEALGTTQAGPNAVAEDFVKAKTTAALTFCTPAFLALLTLMAEGRVMDLILLLIPAAFMLIALPTEGGMRNFAAQVDAIRLELVADEDCKPS